MPIDFDTLAEGLKKANISVADNHIDLTPDRIDTILPLIGFTEELTIDNLMSFFDRKDLNKEYEKRYNETDVSKKEVYSYVQYEINCIYGFHKCMVARHKTRMQYYRDNISQKKYRTRIAFDVAIAKFKSDKESHEQ